MEPVTCPGCQKQYASKPELAGKRVKCKCGGVLEFPAQPEPVDDGAYDFLEEEPVAKPVGGKCPGCGAKTPKEAVICVSCGLNFKTGQKLKTAHLVEQANPSPGKAAGKPPSRSPLPAPPSPRRIPGSSPKPAVDPHEAEKKRQMIVLLSIVGGLALLIGGTVFALKFIGDATGGGAATPLLGKDAEALRLINEDSGVEAKQWITEDPSRRMLGYMNQTQTLARIDQLYAAGAVKVYCSGAAICLTATVELPTDPDKRKALFEWSKNWDERHLLPHTPDVGQRFILVNVPIGPPL
jgi:hypothetical protein